MPTVGPVEILVPLVVATLTVYYGLRGRIPTWVLIGPVLVLLPFVAGPLAYFLGEVLSVVPSG